MHKKDSIWSLIAWFTYNTDVPKLALYNTPREWQTYCALYITCQPKWFFIFKYGTVLMRLEFGNKKRKQVASIGGIRFLLFPSLAGISLFLFLFRRLCFTRSTASSFVSPFGPVPFPWAGT